MTTQNNAGTIPSRSKARWARSPLSRNDYARRRREELIVELTRVAHLAACAVAEAAGSKPPRDLVLGWGRCACCDRDLTTELLEIDHINGREWRTETMNAWRRVARYWREFKAGVALRVLCRSCNARLGGGRRYARGRR